MARTLNEVKKDIIDEINWDSRVDSSDIKVKVNKKHVWLEGQVATYWAKKAAIEDAKIMAKDNMSIINRLNVQYPSTIATPHIKQIISNIKQILHWTPEIDSTNIKVKIKNNKVILAGYIDSFWKKLRTENLASSVSGGMEIINKIAVVPSENYVDESIAKDIVEAIDRKTDVDIDSIDIKVKNGKVTLTGTVDSQNAYRVVYNAAKHTAGVIEIKDKIIIK